MTPREEPQAQSAPSAQEGSPAQSAKAAPSAQEGSSARRSRRPQVPMAQRRAELTEVALRVMARDGAWALTTRAVAAEAGVPHGSVHYAFSSKEALLQAVIAADTDSAVQIFSAAGGSGAGGDGAVRAAPGAVLERTFLTYVDRLVADPGTELALQELTLMAVRDPALAAMMQGSDGDYLALISRLLEELSAAHDGTWDAPVPLIAEQLLGLLFGATIGWLGHRDDDRLRAVLSDAARATGQRLSIT